MTEEACQDKKTRLEKISTTPLPITPDEHDIIEYGLSVMPSDKMIEMERIYGKFRK
jgi:hypothetical protein